MLSRLQLALIYDGTCCFCSASVRWLERFDWRHRIKGIPNQTAGLNAALGLSRARVERAAWAILPDGRRFRGHLAMASALDALVPFGLPLFRAALSLPLMNRLGARLYRWVEMNRGHFRFGPADLKRGAPFLPLPTATLRELERRSAWAPV
jgi:predicted DCC family thiol-disulfide oxidoreductase YuxK